MDDYSVEWPFWDEDGLCEEGTPSLSPKLVAEVLAWADDFNDHYGIDAGWPSKAAARSHERQGYRLRQFVERELQAEDDVVLGYWETNRRKGL